MLERSIPIPIHSLFCRFIQWYVTQTDCYFLKRLNHFWLFFSFRQALPFNGNCLITTDRKSRALPFQQGLSKIWKRRISSFQSQTNDDFFFLNALNVKWLSSVDFSLRSPLKAKSSLLFYNFPAHFFLLCTEHYIQYNFYIWTKIQSAFSFIFIWHLMKFCEIIISRNPLLEAAVWKAKGPCFPLHALFHRQN